MMMVKPDAMRDMTPSLQPALISYGRISASDVTCQLVSSRHVIWAVAVRCASSDLSQTQANIVAPHLNGVSDCSGQPANAAFRYPRHSQSVTASCM